MVYRTRCHYTGMTVHARSAGALPPHMMPSALNPFAMGPPQPLSRDDMPLPYGEHHLMQVSIPR